MWFVESDATLRVVARERHGTDWDTFARNVVQNADEYRSTGVVPLRCTSLSLHRKRWFWHHVASAKTTEETTHETLAEACDRMYLYETQRSMRTLECSSALTHLAFKVSRHHDFRVVSLPREQWSPETRLALRCRRCQALKVNVSQSAERRTFARKDTRTSLLCSTFGFESNDEQTKKFMVVKPAPPHSFHVRGQCNVTYDYENRAILCFKKKSGGRAKTIAAIASGDLARAAAIDAKCDLPLETVRSGRVVFHVRGVAYASCTRCSEIMCLAAEQILTGWVCGACERRERVVACEICGSLRRTKTSYANWTRTWTIVDGGKSPCRAVWTCIRHTPKFLQKPYVWSARELARRFREHNADERAKKRVKTADRRS